jgi:hypothetical protein
VTSDDWLMFFQFLWRSRPRFPRFPLLYGWRLLSAAVLASALAISAVCTAFLGSAGFTAGYGGTGALLLIWCTASARAGGTVWADDDDWADEDAAILRGDLSPAAWKQAGQGQRGEVR